MRNSTKIILICFAVACGIFVGILLAKKPSADMTQEPAETTATEASEVHIIAESIPDNFTIKIPNGFQATSSEYYDTYYICDDASIIITGEEVAVSGTSLTDYSDQMKRIYQQTTENFTLITDELLSLEAGHCRQLEFTYDIIGENSTRTMHCFVAFFLKNDHAYVITCKSNDTSFITYQGSFKNAVKSVRISDDSTVSDSSAPAKSVPAETTAP